jgi:hypothetical protein
MKNLLLSLIILFTGQFAQAQMRIDGQLGGSNFLGASINVSHEFQLFTNNNHIITPTIGFGYVLEYYNPETAIIHFGINYRIKRLGIGIESSRFIEDLIKDNTVYSDMVDLIIYPNINYTLFSKINIYVKISAGAYFAFDKNKYFPELKTWRFAGDIIPGAGLNIGYIFN